MPSKTEIWKSRVTEWEASGQAADAFAACYDFVPGTLRWRATINPLPQTGYLCCYSKFDGVLSLVLRRADVVERRMTPTLVSGHIDVVEQLDLGMLKEVEDLAELGLHHRESALQ